MPRRFSTLFIIAMVLGLSSCAERDVRPKASQLRYTVVNPGTGGIAKDGDTVEIAYTITMTNGDVVVEDDSSIFQLGKGVVIEAIDMAVPGMRVGERRLIDCPPHLHWGRGGYANVIPPSTKLIIDLRLKGRE